MTDFDLTPDARGNPGITGTPVEIAGQTWLLADHVPAPEPVWDRLFDDNILSGQYDPEDTNSAAVRLLFVNYNLSPDEAAGLILEAPRPDLIHAVEVALFGPDQVHRTYSDWVLSSLFANGLDPRDVPPEQLRNVLFQLVATGRAVPAEVFISSAEYAVMRAAL